MRSNDTQSQRLDRSADKLDKCTQAILNSEEEDSRLSVLDDITEKVKGILKNCAVSNAESGESIFEAVAKQYVDAKWKLDILERKVTEVTRNLKETEDLKDAMQMDCEELQSHIDTLLMENQALKSSLPSIPEASEERVASLEMDVEALNEEVKSLLAENKMIRQENLNLTVATESPTPSTEVESSNEDAASTEQLKLDRENATRELKLTLSKVESLEHDLALHRDTVNKLSRENQDLLREKERVEMQLQDWQERGSQKEHDYLVGDLQQRLDKANRDKSNLQDGITCKEKELDELRVQVDAKQSQLAKLCQDNDRLMKENVSLSEQLAATHDESLDKIELLNTEMSLLQQEHEDLKQEVSVYKEEMARAKENLHETRAHQAKLTNERDILRAQYEQLKMEKDTVQSTLTERVTKVQELEEELSLKESVVEEVNSLRNRCQLLEEEREALRLSAAAKSISGDSTHLNKTNDELGASQLDETGNVAEEARVEMRDLTTEAANNVTFDRSKQWTLEQIIDEGRREEGLVQGRNDKLTNETVIVELRRQLQTAVANNKESAEMAKQTIEDLSRLIRAKDDEISVLRADFAHANDTVAKMSNEIAVIGKRRDELEQLVGIKHNDILRYQDEIQTLIRRANETGSKANAEENNRNESQIAEQRNELAALNEKCVALEAALIEEQSNSRILRNQLADSQGKETNAARELERLRTHLVEMESSYTEEALIAEKNREELETKLQQAEEKVKNSSTAYTSASIRANQQVETLQQQMALIIQQRDQIQAKLSATEDNVLLQSASLTNLQIVLEQFQQSEWKSC